MMSRPVPILFTIPNFITAGSVRAMLNIIERLDPERFAPGVCLSKKGGDLDQVVGRLGIPFIEAPFLVSPRPYVTLLWRCFRAARGIREKLKATGTTGLRDYGTTGRGRKTEVSGQWSVVSGHVPQIWHSFHYSDDYTEAIIARMAGAKAWIYTKKNMGWGSRAWKLRTRFASRVAVQNSDMMKSFFGSGSFRAKARSVPRGVDTVKFSPDVPPRLEVRAKQKIPPDAVTVACVAQLLPVKGHPTLIRAVASIPNLHLLLAGAPMDADYVKTLHQLVSDLGLGNRVHFLGGVKDVPALLAESDMFVLSTISKGEGCPVALLEAMSCGRACVATDIPGSRDLVEHERSGLIVPPEDVQALAAALRQLAASSELRGQFGRAARKRVLDHFTIEKEVRAHEVLYEEILRGCEVREQRAESRGQRSTACR